jgi:uncharacterized protein (TIGR03000 family)
MTLALVTLVTIGGSLGAQSNSANPGTAGTNAQPNNPYWSTTPSTYNGTAGGQGVGTGYSIHSPSPLSGSSFGVGMMGLAGSSYSPRPGQYSFSRSFPASMLGYYSPAALAEAATLFAPNPAKQSDNTAHITLQVPAGAEVWFDGKPTRQTGATRHFYSPPLQPGKDYFYALRVRWEQDGKSVEETRRINVRANERVSLEPTRSADIAKSSPSEATR